MELDFYKITPTITHMNITAKDKVVEIASGFTGTVICTHTYKEGDRIASVRIENDGKRNRNVWVPVTQLKKIS